MEETPYRAAHREALRAEMRLYARILAWRDLRNFEVGRFEQDEISRRIVARLNAAQRIWNARHAPVYDPDEIPF